MNRFYTVFFAALLALGLSQTGLAQAEIAVAKTATTETSEADKTISKTVDNNAAVTPAAVDAECKICRWFELDTATLSFRYRTMSDSRGIRGFNQLQHREVFAGRFKFDSEGKYTINVQASSGRFFNWAYADTGWGPGANDYFKTFSKTYGVPRQNLPNLDAGTSQIHVRQLFLSAKPVNGLEFQVGGLPILHGENSETTSYDDDGYITGERISVKRPKELFFNEISFTNAYIGDYFTPNFFRRTNRFGHANYHQLLVAKKIGGRVGVSADYTIQNGVRVMREAVRINVKEAKVIDKVRFEAYQRLNSARVLDGFADENGGALSLATIPGAHGYSIHAEKTLYKRLTIGGGFNNIDYDYNVMAYLNPIENSINGDRMGLGKRVYLTGAYQINPLVSISVFATTNIHVPAEEVVYNSQHFHVALTFDLAKALKRTGVF